MEKVEKQPEGPGGIATKADPSESAEVAGRGKGFIYTCWNDGARFTPFDHGPGVT
jgi:hypothetical protein